MKAPLTLPSLMLLIIAVNSSCAKEYSKQWILQVSEPKELFLFTFSPSKRMLPPCLHSWGFAASTDQSCSQAGLAHPPTLVLRWHQPRHPHQLWKIAVKLVSLSKEPHFISQFRRWHEHLLSLQDINFQLLEKNKISPDKLLANPGSCLVVHSNFGPHS